MVFCHLDSTWYCQGFNERGGLQSPLGPQKVILIQSLFSSSLLVYFVFFFFFCVPFFLVSLVMSFSFRVLWGNHDCGCLPNTTSLVIETHYVGLTHCWEPIQVSRDVDTWSVPHMLLLKVSEHVCNCHCYSNHLQLFFVTLFFRVGFLFLPVDWCVCWIQVFYSLIIQSSLNSMQVDLKL